MKFTYLKNTANSVGILCGGQNTAKSAVGLPNGLVSSQITAETTVGLPNGLVLSQITAESAENNFSRPRL